MIHPLFSGWCPSVSFKLNYKQPFMKSQIELAKEKGIEVGDRVRYVEERKGCGSRLWDRNVTAITDSGVVIDGYDQDIPVQSLEKVENEQQPTIEEVAKIDRAFPHSWSDGDTVHHQFGLTKREYFAAMAMQGLLAANVLAEYHTLLVIQSIGIADALIAELNKGEGV